MYPRNMLCFRYIIVNTMHRSVIKGNNNSPMGTVEEPPMPHYKYEPQPALENSKFKLCYGRSTKADRAVHYNGPDTVTLDTTKEKAYVID